MAIPDEQAAEAFKEIHKRVSIPIVADIHFDYRLALKAIENDADKLRINPGTIGGRENIEQVVLTAKEHGVPIRIGVNAGSLEKDLLKKYGGPAPEALVKSGIALDELSPQAKSLREVFMELVQDRNTEGDA